METYEFDDVLAGTKVTCAFPGLDTTVADNPNAPQTCESLFFPGCSFLNYGLPLVQSVYETLLQGQAVEGISLLCCGKILSYEPNGDQLRADFEEQLRIRIAQMGVKRLVCACPNCVKALRDAFAGDERVAEVEIVALPQLLGELGFTVQPRTAKEVFARREAEARWYANEFASEEEFFAAIENALDPVFAVHDSCPDREVGEFADGLRALMPEGMCVDPAHCRKKSVCCGSLPRAAGKFAAADKAAKLNGAEAVEAGANALVAPCISCCFQLQMTDIAVRPYHYLELLYGWAIDWRATGGLMKLRFLFDENLGADDQRSSRKFVGLAQK
ncbi:MAG: heterodisulfide reductase-related iron-sulfur binding cluster [Coriobacteriia bacterium]|nr:heterodisulfide reductase-related iron-sulfur binding cluster [Coriobacteriia bacterium]